MRKAYAIMPIVFGLFALAVVVVITLLIGREALKIEQKASITDVIAVQQSQPIAQPAVKASVLEAVNKSLNQRKRDFPKTWGWHSVNLLPNEWNDDKISLVVMFYTEEGQKPTDFFIITSPKSSIDDSIPFMKKPMSILALSGFGPTYSTSKNMYSVGQRIISGFGVIHTITEISEDEDTDYLTLDPEIQEVESLRNYLFIQNNESVIQRLENK